MKMNCIEFKRLALSTPDSREHSFVEHSKNCPDCLKYVAEIRQMDLDLKNSIDTQIPTDLVARLQLSQEMSAEYDQTEGDKAQNSLAPNSLAQNSLAPSNEKASSWFGSKPFVSYAMAASFAAALFIAGFMVSGQRQADQLNSDYMSLLSGVVEHMNEGTITPVWGADVANSRVNTLLASYDSNMKLKYMESLQFGRICPMGQYKGLHASLETDNGQVTFAYIKGDSIGDVLNAGYEGYVSRVKPVKGGNLVIISRTARSLEEADTELSLIHI